MYGYPSGIQVEKFIEEQEKSLSEQIDMMIEVIEENKKELEKMAKK